MNDNKEELETVDNTVDNVNENTEEITPKPLLESENSDEIETTPQPVENSLDEVLTDIKEVTEINSENSCDVSENESDESDESENHELTTLEIQSPFDLTPKQQAKIDKLRLKQEKKEEKSRIKAEKREKFRKKVKKVCKVINITLSYILVMALSSLITYTYLDLNGYIVEKLPTAQSQVDPLNPDAPTIDIVDQNKTDVTIPENSTGALTPAQVNAKALPSVVVIQANSIGGGYGTGTGIVLSEDGYIITNSHVVADGDVFTVYTYDNNAFKAQLVGHDAETDLAIIKIEPGNYGLQSAEFGNSDNVVVGDFAFAIGTPGGIELQSTFTGGYISAISREIVIEDKAMTLIQTDAAINPGNSGGPLINIYGQVIGINTIKIVDEEYEGLGFAIPINEAKPILEEIMTYGYVSGRPAIGITGRNISKTEAEQNDIPQGLYVDSVDIRSSAYKAGLVSGDIIVGVNGQTTKSSDEINVIRDNFVAGDVITLNVYRQGRNIDINIELMDQYDLQGEVVVDPNANSNTNDGTAQDDMENYPESLNPFEGFNPFAGIFPFFD